MNKDANRERRAWTEEEDQLLRDAVRQEDGDSEPPTKWSQIAKHVPNRTNKDCRKRWFSKMASVVAKGVWSAEEDERLTEAVELHGNKWSLVAAMVRTRNNDQCAKRWIDTLNPQIDRSAWSSEEDAQLLRAVDELGKSWKKIVETHFPGRSGLAAKNRYNCLARTNFGALRRNRLHRSHTQGRPRPSSSSSSQRSSSPAPSSASSPSICSTPPPQFPPSMDFTDLSLPSFNPQEGLDELLRQLAPPCSPQTFSSPTSPLFPSDILDGTSDSQVYQFSCPSDVDSESFDWSSLSIPQDLSLSPESSLSPSTVSPPDSTSSSSSSSSTHLDGPTSVSPQALNISTSTTNLLPPLAVSESPSKQVTVAVAVAMCEASDLQFTVQTLISGLCKNIRTQNYKTS
ncbi:hypothetical protein CCMSSC00406_0006048 [Pleurotus cornucopiae]|uniref:Uncharacterized protein n=1 Tax=Pleurotus cornucopiae TaxID=5321 RepID=A0ACB7IPK9_PLECO|nr:hypothetical protein CCMSSC00406_0006048 [Pleurotus cornucopiae]